MKKQLLEITSLKYQRRLVREINKLIRNGSPVYHLDYPFNHRVSSICLDRYGKLFYVSNRITYRGNPEYFVDGVGYICASREQ